MNTTNISSSDGSLSNSELFIIIGIVVNVFLQLVVCGERMFKRVESSSCRKSADGTVEVEMKASRENV